MDKSPVENQEQFLQRQIRFLVYQLFAWTPDVEIRNKLDYLLAGFPAFTITPLSR
jgi:hypothetical protein